MNLDRYQEQHAEIHQLLGAITPLLRLDSDAGQARTLLVSLCAKLNIHLAFEDRALYPTLLRSSHAELRSQTQAYLDAVGGLKQAMAQHLQRWLSTEQVLAKPTIFRTETQHFLRALEHRLRSEDLEFYPLIERLG